MPLMPGTRLGPYEILGAIGVGGMGEVYRARHEKLQREVAIKVLPSEVAADRVRLGRFEREARSASALNHPNIVTIHDIAEHDGVTYIAMELVDGRTLSELMTAGPMPVEDVLDVAVQVADGLARAHRAGIVHRDIKPDNVMVTGDGLAKILDFGLGEARGHARRRPRRVARAAHRRDARRPHHRHTAIHGAGAGLRRPRRPPLRPVRVRRDALRDAHRWAALRWLDPAGAGRGHPDP